jgi:capsular polysaccharide biosynthesis protein
VVRAVAKSTARYQLTMLGGPRGGTIIPVDRSVVRIGRSSNNDIVLPDDDVSRLHASLEQHGDELRVTDMGSSNGTYVNDQRLLGPARLRSGDVLGIGKGRLLVELRGGSREPVDNGFAAPAPRSASPLPAAAPAPQPAARLPGDWVIRFPSEAPRLAMQPAADAGTASVEPTPAGVLALEAPVAIERDSAAAEQRRRGPRYLKLGATVLRRWGWMIVPVTLLAGAASFAVSSRIPPTYAATATVLVRQPSSSVTGLEYNDVLASERLAKTYSQMVVTEPVLGPVITQLGLATTPEELSKRLQTRVIRDTQLIQITAQAGDGVAAQRLANAVAQSFIEQSGREITSSFTSQKENLNRQIDRQKGEIGQISATVDSLRSTPADSGSAETAFRLQQLQVELTQAQVTYSNLLKTQQETELAAVRAAEGVRMAQSAAEPPRPGNTPQLLLTIAGAVLGFVTSLGLALLLQLYKRA